jgi:hypothetical protein
MHYMTKTKIKTEDFPDEEIRGQYASDWALYPDNPNLKTEEKDRTGTLSARGDGSASFHHGTVLFDEVDITPDEATGKAHREGSIEDELEAQGLSIGELATRELRKRAKKADTAEEWLQEHDPDYQERQWQ